MKQPWALPPAGSRPPPQDDAVSTSAVSTHGIDSGRTEPSEQRVGGHHLTLAAAALGRGDVDAAVDVLLRSAEAGAPQRHCDLHDVRSAAPQLPPLHALADPVECDAERTALGEGLAACLDREADCERQRRLLQALTVAVRPAGAWSIYLRFRRASLAAAAGADRPGGGPSVASFRRGCAAVCAMLRVARPLLVSSYAAVGPPLHLASDLYLRDLTAMARDALATAAARDAAIAAPAGAPPADSRAETARRRGKRPSGARGTGR